MKEKVLVIDDEARSKDALKRILTRKGYFVKTAERGSQAIELLKQENFGLIITDLMMPEMSGIDVLRQAKALNPDIEVIIVTASATVKSAIEAMREGAFDYIPKPINSEELLLSVNKALEERRLISENIALKRQLGQAISPGEIVTADEKFLDILRQVDKIAPTDATVLIRGESGTGKELIARRLHWNSLRREKPYIALNCATLSTQLLESELFGHVKGAFTGADADRKGYFEVANGGTLFLDEIGDISPEFQLKLLRVLQYGEFNRVGEVKTLYSDIRLIAATNRDLEKAIEEGRFREDLYYRLNVVSIHLPPLRERRDDIEPLANHFVTLYSRKRGKSIIGIAPEALLALIQYEWKGNVRELENVIERAVILCDEDKINLKDLPEQIRGRTENISEMLDVERSHLTLAEMKEKIEKTYIEHHLRANKGNITRTAEVLGIHKKNLHQKIEHYHIDLSSFRQSSPHDKHS